MVQTGLTLDEASTETSNSPLDETGAVNSLISEVMEQLDTGELVCLECIHNPLIRCRIV